MSRMPTAYVPHGGGPWPFVDIGMPRPEYDALLGYLRELPAILPERPKALLVVTAHWEERVATVSTSPAPPMLYDYYGFPAASYQVKWPAPGDPALARRVRDLLDGVSIPSNEDSARGYDHGTFVPMKVAFPAAEVPTVQLSLVAGLDPELHLRVGAALAPLRDEGVFIVGSGMSYHNLRKFFDGSGISDSRSFDAWLRDTLVSPDRDAQLRRWTAAPAARASHPREEHLVPLMVAAGAAGGAKARLDFGGTVFGLAVTGVSFG